ncbi:hypothetical protein ACHQM5_009926 [Ranunculus cassubicifolius]
MGKRGKKHQQRAPRKDYYDSDPDEQSVVRLPSAESESNSSEEEEIEVQSNEGIYSMDLPSKFLLYQESVQMPKGDISYLHKFFLTYIGGRVPLHLQEDFCGTALLSTEWLRADPRRTAVGLDLDDEALSWCLENNVNKIGADVYSRISLFHGNVLEPMEAKQVKRQLDGLMNNMTLNNDEGVIEDQLQDSSIQPVPGSINDGLMKNSLLPARDIVCAFNYSCCCLHKRSELVLYFRHVLSILSKRGGIFVMDVYGGTSSEHELRLQRKFPNFTYFWEQAEFDIVNRMTRISLHFHLRKQQRKILHAFSYTWRLWSLPEIKDCLEEAGFKSVHFWIRQMPDTNDVKNSKAFNAGRDVKYEEVSSFKQQDAWNAYVVGVAK